MSAPGRDRAPALDPGTAGQAPGAPVPRLALSRTEAAQALGVSVDYFDEHVLPDLRIVRRGRRRLIPVAELQRWLEHEAAGTVEGQR